MTRLVLRVTRLVLIVTRLVLRVTRLVLRVTWLLLRVTWLVLRVTRLVLRVVFYTNRKCCFKIPKQNSALNEKVCQVLEKIGRVRPVTHSKIRGVAPERRISLGKERNFSQWPILR